MSNHNDFDKQFRRIQLMGVAGVVVTLAASVAVLGFMGWVIVQIMRHYGII